MYFIPHQKIRREWVFYQSFKKIIKDTKKINAMQFFLFGFYKYMLFLLHFKGHYYFNVTKYIALFNKSKSVNPKNTLRFHTFLFLTGEQHLF